MKTIADKIIDLGGALAEPATQSEVAKLESRLDVSLPEELKDFLSQHNGSSKETDDGIWRFWPCSEITTHKEYRNEEYFCPDNNSLREIDPSAKAVKLPGSRLILFADALIDAPTYGIFLAPDHHYHGMVFDASMGYFSAPSIRDWITSFIDRGEDCLIFPESTSPNKTQ